MGTELEKKPQESILEIIGRAASDPNIDASKMDALLTLQERIMGHEREEALNRALAILAPQLEPLKKTRQGATTKAGDVKFFYTPYEEIDRMLRKPLRDCGLSLSFSTRETLGKPWFVARVTEITKGGYREAMMPYAPDASNSQLNEPQRVASGLSYAKRYTVGMLFNIVTEEQDDDANGTSVISDAQASEIESMMKDGKITAAERKRFLEKIGKADSVPNIQAANFETAKRALNSFIIAKKGQTS